MSLSQQLPNSNSSRNGLSLSPSYLTLKTILAGKEVTHPKPITKIGSGYRSSDYRVYNDPSSQAGEKTERCMGLSMPPWTYRKVAGRNQSNHIR